MNCILRLLVASLFFIPVAHAQTFPVGGTLRDGSGALIGVTVVVNSLADSTKRDGIVTDTAGRFSLPLSPGTYRLRASFIGYQTLETTVRVDSQAVELGELRLFENANQLKEVTVIGQQLRVEMKGDTTQFNAGAYKVNPDATAEDLIKKLPGITLENGAVKTQGEDVKRVLIDGKPFFGDDASLALRNLPAEVIDKIQVFDRLSDQSQFTGFDDGNTDKTINIVTRPGRNNGQFGKVFAGVGTDGRYAAGANTNLFKGDRRISVLGLFNNINQQNFSSQDLLGALGGTSGRGGAGGARGGGGGRGNAGGGPGGGGQGGGGANPSNFLVGQQGGIATTNALGLNYSDSWGKKITVSGSYFFNNTRNLNTNISNRTYFTNQGQTYDERETRSTNNFNHRFNFRFEYKIDSSNSLLITPSLSLQNTASGTNFIGENRLGEGSLLSRTQSDNTAQNQGYTFSNNLLFQHKFGKQGRTMSVGLTTSVNDRDGTNRLTSDNEFYGTTDSTFRLNQLTNSFTNGYTLSGNLTYTEPLSRRSQLQLSYVPSYTDGNTDKKTYNVNGVNRLDTTLSNTFASQYFNQRVGTGYRYRNDKWFITAGLFYQTASLRGDQTFPRPFVVDKTFGNWLPNAMLQYRFSRQDNLRLMYRTSTDFPSVNQLQNVIDNSNPLQLRAGNPDLRQEYTHSLTARYNVTNPKAATSFFALLSANFTSDNITSTTFLASRDTVIARGVTLYAGSQLTRPVNLDGYRSVRTFFTYGMPFKPLKSNLNLNLGYTYTRTPGLLNNALNLANTSVFNGGFVLSSSTSEKLDFTLSYSGNYNLVRNTLRPQLNSNYYFHSANAQVNWLLGKGFLLNTNLTQTLYSGLGDGFDQRFLLWNASAGKKFGKKQLAELKLTVFDLLKQNNSIARNVTETYVEDTQTQVLQQYAMLTFTYTFRNFGVASAPATPERGRFRGGERRFPDGD